MPGLRVHVEGAPDADEIRAALEHMAASEAFRGSPQLVAFLRYVVEATLRGAADRIKGYTIATEALGRGENFDPQSDPIVRVEAMRLRRALSRYYQNGGKHDAVAIDLPLGSYVPSFRRVEPAPPAPQPVVAPAPQQSPHNSSSHVRWRPPRAGWRSLAAGTMFLLTGAAVYAGFDFWLGSTPASPSVAFTGSTRVTSPVWRDPPPYPVVFVGPFQAARANDAQPVDTLRGKLRDALARFDEIQVVAAAAPNPDGRLPEFETGTAVSRYSLTATLQPEFAGRTRISLRLTDARDGRVIYARRFDQVMRDGELAPGEDAIVREVAAALAQPYGIIQAYESARDPSAETQYLCLAEAYDYWRTHDPKQHRRALDCLERAIAASPGFALGHAALSALVLEEFRGGIAVRPGERPPLQRALHAARRAVELKPGSARAHQALADVQFARGDHLLALEAAERAMMLNPYDPNILADFGAHLVAMGEQERGVRMIREAAAVNLVRPARQDFYLFLAAYLAGDAADAARYAALMAPDAYPLGLVARAIVAVSEGEIEQAKGLVDRLAALRSGWHHDIRRELKKYFASEKIVDRIARDLAPIAFAHGQ